MRHWVLTLLGVLGLAVSSPAPSVAQSLELGVTTGTHQGGQVSVWFTPRFEWVVRLAWKSMAAEQGFATYYMCQDRTRAQCPVRILIRSSGPDRLSSGEVLFHFRPTKRVRPSAGVGRGVVSHVEHRSCEVPGCEPQFPAGFFEDRRERTIQLSPSVGASTAVGGHTVARAGLRFHNLIFEGASLEAFVSVGYRF
jgi:hypothetical protein